MESLQVQGWTMWKVVCALAVAGAVSVQGLAQTVAGQTTTSRDSAGVWIVTSSDPPASADLWSLSERPLLVLGGVTSDLWQIRDYLRLPDGSVVVLSAGTSDVRVFDRDGTERVSFGRSGRGPGEFEFPLSVTFVEPDTLLVLDRGSIEVFLLDGTFLRSESARIVANGLGPGTSARPFAVAPDRSMVLVGGRPVTATQVGPDGVFRPAQGLGFLPGPDQTPILAQWYEGGLQQRVEVGGGSTVLMPPFARHSVFGLGPTGEHRFYAADNSRYQIDIYDGSGVLRRIVRREIEPVRVRSEWVEWWKEVQRGRSWTQGRLEGLERAWSRMSIPESLPAFDDVVFDTEGWLWVRRPTPDPRESVSFDVFDPEGALRRELVVPFGITGRPRIDGGSFVAVWEDATGVETVRVYGLRR